MQVRTRFAPSPTGYLHLGGLRTALYTYLFARKEGGRFILRIEDTDQEREVPGAVEKIYASMRAAGLEYDEGPDVGGECGPYIQSLRKDTYLPYAKKLVETGHAYYCFCTKERLDEARAEAEKKGETFKYDKHCLSLSKEEVERRLANGEPYVIRQNIPSEGKAGFDDVLYGHVEVDCSTLDDNVLIKADGLPTYNFANVIDDHLMGITHVTRGTEYLSSAPKYNLLYEAFGWTPPVYIHLSPVMCEDVKRDKMTGLPVLDEEGKPVTVVRKLSKRYGDPSFEDLLERGFLRDAVVNYIALLGWAPQGDKEFFTREEMNEAFDLRGLSKSPSVFDMNKLVWMNAEYTRNLPFDEYMRLAKPWFDKALPEGKYDLKRLSELLQGRTEVMENIPGMVDFLEHLPPFDEALYTHKKMKTDPAVALTALRAVLPVLESVEEWTEEALHDRVMEAIPATGMKNGQVLWPLRIALTNTASTPGGAFEVAYLLGRDESLRRVKDAIERLS